MQVLRQSTSQAIQLGPFVDSTDGVTPETSLTISNTDIKISKDGGVSASKNLGGASVDGNNGFYTATLDSTDTNTIGSLKIDVAMAGALPVWFYYQVIEDAVYDGMFANGATALATAASITALNDFDAATDAVANVTLVGTTTTNTDVTALNNFDPAVDPVASVTLVATTTNVTNEVDANITAVNADATAPANLASMYNGTGYNDDTAPASRAQVGNLSTGSAAISTVASLGVENVGVNITGDYTDTFTLNQVYHAISDSAGNFDVQYDFSVGGSGVGVNIVMTGYLAGNGDELAIQAYNWDTLVWDQVGILIAGASTPAETVFNLNISHTGTGVNAGTVQIRGYEAAAGLSNVDLYLDQVYISYAVVSQTVGYADGAIWVDTINGTDGVEDYVNGTADNPCTWDNASILSASLGLTKFRLSPGSSITLVEDASSWEIRGVMATMNLGNQLCSSSHFHGLIISGTASAATTNRIMFMECSIGTVVIPPANFDRCGFTDVATSNKAGDYFLVDAFSLVSGSGSPTFDSGLGIGPTNISIRRWGGGLSIDNIETGDVVSAEATVGGTLTLDGTSGDVEMRGGWKGISDLSAGAVSIVRSKTYANIAAISDNETSAINLAASALGITKTTVSSVTDATEFTLVDGNALNDIYIGRVVVVTSGTQAGEAQTITDYIGSTKTVTVSGFTAPLSIADSVVIV